MDPVDRTDTASRISYWLTIGSGRTKMLLLLVALVVIGFGIYEHFNRSERQENTNENLRIPVTNPLLEPDRPDLIGEPRIDDQPDRLSNRITMTGEK